MLVHAIYSDKSGNIESFPLDTDTEGFPYQASTAQEQEWAEAGECIGYGIYLHDGNTCLTPDVLYTFDGAVSLLHTLRGN